MILFLSLLVSVQGQEIEFQKCAGKVCHPETSGTVCGTQARRKYEEFTVVDCFDPVDNGDCGKGAVLCGTFASEEENSDNTITFNYCNDNSEFLCWPDSSGSCRTTDAYKWNGMDLYLCYEAGDVTNW